MNGPSNHTPQKRWGQNFLHDRRAIDRISHAIDPEPGAIVLEIGPGKGALTAALLDRGFSVTAFEIDGDLVAWLRSKFEGRNLEVVQVDAIEAPLPPGAFHAFGNLPYNVANPIIARIVRHPGFLSAAFMVQKEVAERYTSPPGRKAYGYLTVATQIHADCELVLELGPGAFRPQPKVRSAVVRFERAEPDLMTPADALEELISTAFRMRRKTLLNNLAGFEGRAREAIESALGEAGIEPAARAESLTLDDFDRLGVSLGLGRAPS